jgi:hypothetical protein
MIDPAINPGWFEIVKATNKSETFIQDLFHNTCLASYPQPHFIVFDDGRSDELNVSSNKYVCMRSMEWKPNQLQVTTKHTSKIILFGKLGKQSWKSRKTRRFFIWLLPSINCMITCLLEVPITKHCRQHHANFCFEEIWSTIMPSEQIGIEYKNKIGHYW